jgi:hypothetical protein
MEKLIEELIDRLQETRQGIISELKSNPVDSNNRISLLLSGEVLAYDACIKELRRMVIYCKESNLKS